jgi:20S proteasome alpha/beta subunit
VTMLSLIVRQQNVHKTGRSCQGLQGAAAALMIQLHASSMSVMMKLLTTHHFLTLSIILEALVVYSSAQKFDPYQLNGGLVAAVAGKDYVLIASDTRLTDGGYGVHSRRYLSGRLWSASSASSSTSSAATAVTNDSVVSSSSNGDVSIGDGDKNNIIITTRSNNNLLQSPSTIHCWDSDGSLLLPPTIQNNNIIISTNAHTASLLQHESLPPPTTTTITNPPPTIIGSAGCASDCESLKRRMRLELDAFDNNNNHNLCVSSVANLLQQILYSRRGFPFYSFCVVAGLIPPSAAESLLSGGGGGSGKMKKRRIMEGAVYVYDAIGSYERVAVGSAGTGRELLQPILDQLFSGSATTAEDHDGDGGDKSSITIHNNDNHSNNGKSGDILAIPPMKQRVGVAGSLRPPVPTTVRCTVEDAVRNVARAYQSVAEREISVGDEVVICVVRSAATASSSSAAAAAAAAGGEEELVEGAVLKVYRYPLKKH